MFAPLHHSLSASSDTMSKPSKGLDELALSGQRSRSSSRQAALENAIQDAEAAMRALK